MVVKNVIAQSPYIKASELQNQSHNVSIDCVSEDLKKGKQP